MAEPIAYPHPTNPTRYPNRLMFTGVDIRGGRSYGRPVVGKFEGGYRAIYTRPDGTRYEHSGVDISCPTGTPIHAPARGRVANRNTPGGFGLWVRLDHEGTPYWSAYGHLSEHIPELEGQVVEAGTVIGYSGNTGYSTGPHVHWGVAGPNNADFVADHNQLYDPLAFASEEAGHVWPPTDWGTFAARVLTAIQANPTAWAVAFLRRWAEHEGTFRTDIPHALYNPLNTTQGGPSFASVGAPPPPSFVDGAHEWFNTFGQGAFHVRNYPSQEAGEQATIETLTNGFYPDVVATLRAGRVTDRQKVADQVAIWGTVTFADELRAGWGPQVGGEPEVPADIERLAAEVAEMDARLRAEMTARGVQDAARNKRSDLVRIANDPDRYRDWVVPLHERAVQLGAAPPRD